MFFWFNHPLIKTLTSIQIFNLLFIIQDESLWFTLGQG